MARSHGVHKLSALVRIISGVYVEWFVVDLDCTKGGRKTCSLSLLAAYMPGERIALKG